MKILGIDPGSTRAGYGLIEKDGSKLSLVASGLLDIKTVDKEQRLLELAESYEKLLKEHKPDLVSLEKLYFVKNIKTGMDVAQSRGVIIFLTKQNNVPIVEYAPSEVKLAVSGYGSADKKAVEKMVKLILNCPELKAIDDVFDALAAAIAASGKNAISDK